MRTAAGSALRAWVVGHDGFRVATMLLAVALGASLYAFVRVPGQHGGPIPLWLLTPPTLAMFAALAVHNDIPEVGWSTSRLRRARLLWAFAVVASAGLAAQLVGWSAGQARMGLLTAALTALTLGLACVVGRGSLALGAGLLVVTILHTRAVSTLTPAAIWAGLGGPLAAGLGLACVLSMVAYAAGGSRSPWGSLAG